MPDTARLHLRRPRMDDAEAFAAINADPEVARFVNWTGPLSRAESDLMLRKTIDHWDDHGFGWWMADLRETGELLGFIGLARPFALAALADDVEVGWRLARAHWGRGLATEGAREAVRFAFAELALERLVCIIDRDNERSLGVARNLGFEHWRDMEHPRWPRGVQVYTLTRDAAVRARLSPSTRAFMEAFGPAYSGRDIEALEQLLDPDVEIIDHRILGWEPMRGRAAIREGIMAQLELSEGAPDVSGDLIDATPDGNAYLSRDVWSSRTTLGGGDVEHHYFVIDVIRDGRLLREEMFDDEAQARAAFAALG